MSLSLKPSHLATYKDVATLFLKYGSKAGFDQTEFAARFEVNDEVKPSEDARDFARDLERLGPTFVKIGQLLSTRPDLLPPDWMVALQRLQDDVEPVDLEEIQDVIEEELGARLSKLFVDFEETPLASASLSQVHRAVLRESGERVAVKVQRPGIREKVFKELQAIGEVADFFEDKTHFGRQFELGRMVQQFRRSIVREVNFLDEASNLDRLADNLGDSPGIIVPRPHSDYCSSKVLTMDYVRGTKITELSGVIHTELDGSKLAETLFASYLKQVLVDGFFHADPHPGNILLTPDRKLALLDLGMTGSVPDRLKDLLLQLLSATSEGRSSEAADVAQRMGTPRDDYDADRCEEEISRIVEKRRGASVEEIQVGEMVLEVTQACGQNGLRIPESIYMLGKMLLNLDLIGKALDPEFNPDDSVRRHTAELANRRFREHLTPGNIFHVLTDLKEFFSETPSRLNDFLSSLARNKFEVKVDAIDEENLLRGFHRVANRITVGLILSALIVGAAMMMNIDSKFTILGYPGLAIIFFLAAAVGGLLLVFNIIISEMGPRKK